MQLRNVAKYHPLMIWQIVGQNVVCNPIDDHIRIHCLRVLLAADGAETVPELPKAGVGYMGDSRGYQTNALSL
jgi:hypothetical protein